MPGLSFSHLLVVLLVALILFGSGKISSFMTELAKGIKSFKKALHEEDEEQDKKTIVPKKD